MELLRQHVTALSERVHRQADGSARARDDEDDSDRDGGPHQRLLLVQRFGVRKTLPAEHSAIDEDAFDDLGVAVAVDDERYRVEDDQRDDPAHVFEGLPGVADVGGVAVRDAVNEGDQDRREANAKSHMDGMKTYCRLPPLRFATAGAIVRTSALYLSMATVAKVRMATSFGMRMRRTNARWTPQIGREVISKIRKVSVARRLMMSVRARLRRR